MEKRFTDQLGKTISLNYPPQRIVSLVPSLTELCFDLGLADRMVGITQYCNKPEFISEKVVQIGGTKDFDCSLIESLSPDLIIANKEENTKEGIEYLSERFPVWISEINSLPTALEAIVRIGEITDKQDEAFDLSVEIRSLFIERSYFESIYSVAYIIWRKPYMTVGGDTFIHDILTRSGFKNVFADQLRYPIVSKESLIIKSPDLILLSSEPFPYQEKHIAEFMEMCPASKVILVNGEYFSWYGSRLIGTMKYIDSIRSKLIGKV